MILKPLTNGKVTGTGTVKCESRLFGGALISTDGTNAAAVTIQNDTNLGALVFDISSKTPWFYQGPIICSDYIYYSISGTGASAQLYEWVD